MYHGEVSVQEEELPALLKIAEALKVKGLVEPDDKTPSANKVSPVRPKVTSTNSHGPSSTNPKLPIWPVSTNKLLSPKTVPDSGQIRQSQNENPTDEDPGHLVIDEGSYDGGNITMVR